MVGIPVTIEYDEAWDGLTKNLVCRCSPWNCDSGETRTILNVEETSVVAHEVMKADMSLYLGVEGFREDGRLVMPTVWARCGTIQYGANADGDPSADPSLPVWNQLQAQIEQINRDGITQEKMDELHACAESAAQSAADAARSEVSATASARLAASSANAAEAAGIQAKTSEENAKTSAFSAANLANGALQAQRAAEAAAERAELAADSLQESAQGGLTAAQVGALDGLFGIIKYESDPTGAYAAFCEAFGIAAKTLVSISAAYTGGEVAVGTALSSLTGITVTATYSDGSTGTVTGYTLSGEIAEGSNTITITYGGRTAAITVVGVASGTDEPAEPLYGRFWPPANTPTNWSSPVWNDVDNFAYSGNAGSEYVNAGFPAGAMIRLDKLQGTVYIRTLTNNQYGYLETAYKVYANSDGEIATGGFAEVEPVIHRQIGGQTQTMEVNGTTYYFVLFEFNVPAGKTGYFVSTANAAGAGLFISSDPTAGIDDAYKPYYTLFASDPSDRITEPATEVA